MTASQDVTLQPFKFLLAVVGCHDAHTVSQLRPLCCIHAGLLDIPFVSRQCDAIHGSPIFLYDSDIRRNKMKYPKHPGRDGELLRTGLGRNNRSTSDTNLKTMRIGVRVVIWKRSASSIAVLVGELDAGTCSRTVFSSPEHRQPLANHGLPWL